MGVPERLKEYIKYHKMTVAEFERLVGLSNGAVNNMTDRTRQSTYERLSKRLPDLNIYWLRTGKGNMLIENEGNAKFIGVPVKPMAEDMVQVRYYEISPTASFVEFCSGQSEYSDTISVVPMRGDDIDDESCVFKIRGESMAPQIQSGALVLCTEISPTRWHQLEDVVVVTAYADKFVIKRIIENELDSKNFFVLASDNPDFGDEEKVALCDIRCVFLAQRIISQKIF